jgi:hypothetical protein
MDSPDPCRLRLGGAHRVWLAGGGIDQGTEGRRHAARSHERSRADELKLESAVAALSSGSQSEEAGAMRSGAGDAEPVAARARMRSARCTGGAAAVR